MVRLLYNCVLERKNVSILKLYCLINKNLSDWSILPNSFFARINVIRMNILPRLNFLFQNLPCYLNTNFFKRINSSISRYIWNHKKPRLKLSVLMKPKELWGVSLHNFQLYFWSAQIKYMLSWFIYRFDSHCTLKNKGASWCHRRTFLSKWFHKEPLTSEEPFCFTKGSLWWKKVLQIIKR